MPKILFTWFAYGLQLLFKQFDLTTWKKFDPPLTPPHHRVWGSLKKVSDGLTKGQKGLFRSLRENLLAPLTRMDHLSQRIFYANFLHWCNKIMTRKVKEKRRKKWIHSIRYTYVQSIYIHDTRLCLRKGILLPLAQSQNHF